MIPAWGLPQPGAPWRSQLYPENWTPGTKDAQGRFLHDFSYAGYHAGEAAIPAQPPGLVYDASRPPYSADSTGAVDATPAIQRALDDAGNAGGGIVYLPEGTYTVKPQGTNAWALRISKGGVVLRGAGADKTRLYLNDNVMRMKAMILVAPPSRSWTTPLAGSEVLLARDLLEPTKTLPLASAPTFQVGEWVIVRGDVTPEFIAEHGMQTCGNPPTTCWTTDMPPQLYYRRVTAVDAASRTITLDGPTRYVLKTRDNARVYKVAPHIEETGIEYLSLGMRENLKAGLGEQEYTVPGTAAYEVHNSHAITFDHVVNGWVREVRSYRPPSNTQDWHTLSNGIELNRSRFVTVTGCHFAKPQYRGGGGNGYPYDHSGNDGLITRSVGERGRHNFSFRTMLASGSVVHRSTAIEGSLVCDFHRHLTVAGLVDNVTLVRDAFEARLRPFGTVPLHGHAATESVFWNTTGQEAAAGKNYVVQSSQFGWGYVIGTQGAVTRVELAADPGTLPVDFLEGEGLGATLVPESLYEDQLSRRLGASGLPSLSIDDRSAREGRDANAAFRVFLSRPSDQTVTVSYQTADGTAGTPSDYAATSGTLTFTPGRTQHSIFVPVVSDTTAEPDESFVVNLSSASGASILDGQAVGTISDSPAAQHVPMYRSYNKGTDYHFFTTTSPLRTSRSRCSAFRTSRPRFPSTSQRPARRDGPPLPHVQPQPRATLLHRQHGQS